MGIGTLEVVDENSPLTEIFSDESANVAIMWVHSSSIIIGDVTEYHFIPSNTENFANFSGFSNLLMTS